MKGGLLIKKVKTRNNGTWTEARYNTFIKGLIRAGLMRWGPKHLCISNARIKRGWYLCEGCEEEVPATLPPKDGGKKRIKNIQADHIHPMIDPEVGFVDWDTCISRAFVEVEGYQALCHKCHQIKTQEERSKRNNNK